MYYFFQHKEKEYLKYAQEKYPWFFEQTLSDESREVRYHLLEYLEKNHSYYGELEKDIYGKPIPIVTRDSKKIYWSVSHSENFIAFTISQSNTGIDICEMKERDNSLLGIHSESEYEILGERNWKNFYILWTTKESIIKAYGKSLDDIGSIRLREILGDGIYSFEFEDKRYRIQTIVDEECIISFIC